MSAADSRGEARAADRARAQGEAEARRSPRAHGRAGTTSSTTRASEAVKIRREMEADCSDTDERDEPMAETLEDSWHASDLASAHLRSSAFSCGCLPAARAAVTATDAWVRGTVPAQKTTGAFLTLNSSEDAKLVARELARGEDRRDPRDEHEGRHDAHARDRRRSRFPPASPCELEPGGYHVMLIDLAKPLEPGRERCRSRSRSRTARASARSVEVNAPREAARRNEAAHAPRAERAHARHRAPAR